MASSSNKGAAEEPKPEPGPPPSSSSSAATATVATAPYDPREYQPAHPDDRGGDGKPAKKGGGGKAKAKGEGENGKEDKGKADEDEDGTTHRCGNCDAPDAKSKCKGCGVEYYCNRECQKVSVGLGHGSGSDLPTVPIALFSFAHTRYPSSHSFSGPGGSGDRHSGQVSDTPFARSSATHPVQNACPHGSVVGSRGGSRQMRHLSASCALLQSRSCCAWAAAATT